MNNAKRGFPGFIRLAVISNALYISSFTGLVHREGLKILNERRSPRLFSTVHFVCQKRVKYSLYVCIRLCDCVRADLRCSSAYHRMLSDGPASSRCPYECDKDNRDKHVDIRVPSIKRALRKEARPSINRLHLTDVRRPYTLYNH